MIDYFIDSVSKLFNKKINLELFEEDFLFDLIKLEFEILNPKYCSMTMDEFLVFISKNLGLQKIRKQYLKELSPFFNCTYLIFIENKLVAYTIFFPSEDKQSFYIHQISISCKFQNNGFGKKLIQIIENIAKKEIYNTISLRVEKEKKALLTYYSKLGFSLKKEEKEYYFMEKKLN
ncbi:MAG: GNAT family N-acetyltransferase [Nanoarchaeota archaeon]|nr:GNAT family N-acetyltransferase [Nanoarchaeota archaeon]